MVYRRPLVKNDQNQADIEADLRKIGCSVVSLAAIGKGCPDLLVGYRGCTILLEVKNPDGRNKLTKLQETWNDEWRGCPAEVVRSPEEAVSAVLRQAVLGRVGHGQAHP